MLKETSYLSVRDAYLTFGAGRNAVSVLKGITIGFAPGQMTLLIGPSGSGKTTLLSVLGCILNPDSGQVTVMEQTVTLLSEQQRTSVRRRQIGFVFQAFRLFHSLTAQENVALPLRLAGCKRAEQQDRARAALVNLGMEGRLRHKPKDLSGGEKQRVAVARAIVLDPPIVLADEPTASLDSESGLSVAALLRDIAEGQKRVVVVVSHDERLRPFAHRTVRMLDGRIVEGEDV